MSRPPNRRRLPAAALVACLGCGAGEAAPFPPFTYAGVIEGFYGTPWSHQDRLDMLAFMGEVGLTDYVYAPKDDPYHRERWREPYPEPAFAQLAELADSAAARGVRLWYAVSPGLSMTYADSTDYAVLLMKLERVASLGVGHFGLFLDDVPFELTEPADRARYASIAEAHVALTNRLHADLAERGLELMLTPTTYTNAWGDRGYLDVVGAGVHADVPIIWTGVDVASPRITREAAAAWGESLRRDPLVWDNVPVNDYARWRVFLGPITGRDPELSHAATGIIANPMNQAHASMITLHTLAAYARDPAHYQPEEAHRQAVTDLLGPAAEAFAPFLEAFGGAGWEPNPFEDLYFLADTIPLAPLEAILESLEEAAARSLELTEDGRAAAIVREVTPFIARQREEIDRVHNRPDYRARNDTLFFDAARDRYRAETGSRAVDGEFADWPDPLTVPLAGAAPAPTVGFAADGDRVYVAIDIPHPTPDVRSGSALGEGDHTMIVIDVDPSGPELTPEDFVILVPPPSADSRPTIVSLSWTGFMAKWLRDNANLTLSTFHITSMGSPHPAAEMVQVATTGSADGGHHVELGFPRNGDAVALTIQHAVRRDGRRRVSALPSRNYPINPGTYARLTLPARTGG